MRAALARAAVLAVVGILLVQAAGAPVAAQTQSEAPMEAADEIYVQDDGGAVVVYDAPASATDVNNTEFGISTEENVAYLLMTDPVAGTPEVTGGLEIGANRTAIVGQGNLTTPRPDAIQAFDLALSGETTAERSESQVSFATTVRDDTGASQAIESATTEGTVTVGADRVTGSGQFYADVAIPIPERSQQSYSLSIAEADGGYSIDIAGSQLRNPQFERVPENRSVAKRNLDQQYAFIAQGLGGEATVTLDEFDRSAVGEMVRVDQSYTVRLEGIDAGLEDQIRRTLERDPDTSAAQAERMASAVGDVEIRDLTVEYEVGASEVTANASVDVRGYGPLVKGYMEMLANADASAGVDVERVQAQLDAQRAADMEQTFEWSGNLTHPDDDTVRVALDADSEASNWATYVDELESRDVPLTNQRYEVTGDVDGEQLVFEGSGSLWGEALYAELTRGLPAESEMTERERTVVDAIRDSRPEKAGLAATYDADGVRVEAAASFGNLSALTDAVAEVSGAPSISEVTGRLDGDGGETYVRVPAAVEGEPSESAVRSLPYVDSETTIHMPGEGEREFPETNADRARTFLDGVATSASGPGFGVAAALAGLLGAAFLLRYRREP